MFPDNVKTVATVVAITVSVVVIIVFVVVTTLNGTSKWSC
jgi:hypothetical protein